MAYRYDAKLAVAVEIESRTEVSHRKVRVLKNMKKWKDLGFDKCHVWSTHKGIAEIRSQLDREADHVVLYLVSEDGSESTVME